jgi:2-hydroxymuconate-semialdehyde hydrolase
MNNPEIGKSIFSGGIQTNFHDEGSGRPVLLIHGSGPGVSAWANWRTNIPVLSQRVRTVAPDIVGFGFTDRPDDGVYTMELWGKHLIAFVDALGLAEFDIIGNSFGGALAIAIACKHPDRVRRMVLMGSAGVDFELTDALDAVWGYEPSVKTMRGLLDLFAYDRSLATDELANLRYQASIQPGFQEAFSAMFPAPRQESIRALATAEEKIAKIDARTLILHGREDLVIPLSNSLRLFRLIHNAQLHVFDKCGHWTQIEHKDKFNSLVGDFLCED